MRVAYTQVYFVCFYVLLNLQYLEKKLHFLLSHINTITFISIATLWRNDSNELNGEVITRKSESELRTVTSKCSVRHIVRKPLADRTTESWQYVGQQLKAYHCLHRLLHHELRAGPILNRIPLQQNHLHLRLQCSHEHRDMYADWQQVLLSGDSQFKSWYHHGCIRVKHYAGEHYIQECYIVDDHNYYELWVIWKDDVISVKRSSPKSSPFFSKALLGISLNSILPTRMLQRRFFVIRTLTTSFVAGVFSRYFIHCTCRGFP